MSKTRTSRELLAGIFNVAKEVMDENPRISLNEIARWNLLVASFVSSYQRHSNYVPTKMQSFCLELDEIHPITDSSGHGIFLTWDFVENSKDVSVELDQIKNLMNGFGEKTLLSKDEALFCKLALNTMLNKVELIAQTRFKNGEHNNEKIASNETMYYHAQWLNSAFTDEDFYEIVNNPNFDEADHQRIYKDFLLIPEDKAKIMNEFDLATNSIFKIFKNSKDRNLELEF